MYIAETIKNNNWRGSENVNGGVKCKQNRVKGYMGFWSG